MEYIQILRKFIIENFLFGEEQEIKVDTNLLEKGIIDSTGVVELVSYLEETYNIVIEDDELVADNFSCLQYMDNFLKNKINGNTN